MKKQDLTYLENVKYFSNLSDRQLKIIVDAPENGIIEYKSKEIIFHENDIGEYLYVMLEGLAEVFVKSNSTYRDISIASLRPGDCFGDGAATSVEERRHTATIKVALDSRVFRIHKKHVLNAIEDRHMVENLPPNRVRDTLQAIPIFKGLTIQELKDVNFWSRTSFFGINDLVYEPGDEAKKLFVVMEGTVQLFRIDQNGKKQILAKCTSGQYFGEMELLPGAAWKYDHFAEVISEAQVVLISKDVFLGLLDRNKTLATYLKKMHQLKKLNREAIL